mmetsp:Transcript_103076/g.250356  ORF Transcript_103076/g.250356 Transcript_103076/m.250356 type:complete len:472 (-) Transcript_103076:31-1446(-)
MSGEAPSPAKRARMEGSAGGAGGEGATAVPPQIGGALDEVAPPTSSLKSWVEYGADHDFSIQNLPFGVVRMRDSAAPARCAMRIGDFAVDLSGLAARGLLPDGTDDALRGETLNAFMALGRPQWRAVRNRVQELLSAGEGTLRDDAEARAEVLIPIDRIENQLGVTIGDYTDFYASREHATNVGTMFRGKDNALQPNWLHLPVGYHGRASSVVTSGTPARRPCGQLALDAKDLTKGSGYGPCRLMDYELEMGVFVGTGNDLGETIDVKEADDHIFGYTLMNDWSARDIQKFEYVPLGPFTAKNFMTTLSPWIVTVDALEPFAAPTSAGAQTDPVPLPYLQDPKYGSYDIRLEVQLASASFAPHTVARSNFRNMYWNARQMLAHHTVTGCNMRPGDLFGSGTISGASEQNYGSLLELCWKGTRPATMPDGTQRKFLKDGDTVIMKGYAQGDGFRVGFGECTGEVLPAKPYAG